MKKLAVILGVAALGFSVSAMASGTPNPKAAQYTPYGYNHSVTYPVKITLGGSTFSINHANANTSNNGYPGTGAAANTADAKGQVTASVVVMSNDDSKKLTTLSIKASANNWSLWISNGKYPGEGYSKPVISVGFYTNGAQFVRCMNDAKNPLAYGGNFQKGTFTVSGQSVPYCLSMQFAQH